MQASAASALEALRARVAALPGWVWVGSLVVLSTVVRALLARKVVAPWIFSDELFYSELAKSFGSTGHFAIRGEASSAYGFVYPVLVAPAYALFGSIPRAYAAVKGINAALMSLSAVPIYLLARRVVSVRGALVAVTLTLVLPAFAYTATIMTENAFMPLFCLTALVLVRALEKPTLDRQGLVLLVLVADFLTRAQAVAFLPAVVVAPLLYAAFAGRAAQLRRYIPLGTALAGLTLLAILVQAVRGRSPLTLLGAYAVTGHTHYPQFEIARWTLYHLALVDMGLALVPLFALVLLLARARRLDLPLQALLAATVSLGAFLLLEVAAFSVTQSNGRLEERNLFYVYPLLLVALVAWVERGMPRPWHIAAPTAAVLAVLPALIPFGNDNVFGVASESDTPTLVAWWYVQHSLVARGNIWLLVLAAGVAFAALALWLPRRFGLLLAPLIAAALVLMGQVVLNWNAGLQGGMRAASIGALYQGVTQDHPDWVDRALGRDARVTFLWTAGQNPFVLRETQFFNRSVRTIADVETGASPERLGEVATRIDEHGRLRAKGDGVLQARYVLAPAALHVAGTRLATDRLKGLALYRTPGPLGVTGWAHGIDPDAWSTPSARYSLAPCRGRFLDVRIGSDSKLFGRPQRVVARENGVRVGVLRLDPAAPEATWSLPLRPRAGMCRFDFTVTPTRVPGHGDPRRLGARFLGFAAR
jgi:hypothetical protein